MGWQNPPVPWRELERRLSDARPPAGVDQAGVDPAGVDPAGVDPAWNPGGGGDSPAWSRKRQPYEPPQLQRGSSAVPYAELHCHSFFSFLDGASSPEELVEEAVRQGLQAMALTDRNGFYGVVRFAEAARELGLPTVFGSQLSLAGPNEDPATSGSELVVLARSPQGYAALGQAISKAQMAGEKGAPRITLPELGEIASGDTASGKIASGNSSPWLVLTGCSQGAVPQALLNHGPAAARRELDGLIAAFGRDNVVVELWDHGEPLDSARNDALARLALSANVQLVATNSVRYHVPSRRRLATAVAAVKARNSLDEMDGWLPPAATAHLRSGAEQAIRFARYPGVVERSAELAAQCAFDLQLVAPQLPPYPCASGQTEMDLLWEITRKGATRRYGPQHAPLVPGAWEQIQHELAVIEKLNFPGYFLIVWDIVEFCRRSDIYCQGRGSAANSAVCYALGITNADAVSLGLLFERFLSAARDGPPDIDIDIESDRREEVIQYVYQRYGRQYAAQVANVITYRSRSAVRDMAKALGYAPGQQDAFTKSLDRWAGLAADQPEDSPVPQPVLELARELEHSPRHLGIHSGGMVICDRPIVEVCPIEWARMENRSVLQWDKDDCAAAGLVKFDLLGLGMLSVIHYAVDLVADHHGVQVDIATLPQESVVYDMLCKADSIGVFQVESRAQMATLPRLKPRNFYDLVVEVALIRPGPIQGGSVHPYIRRRNGKEAVTYLHPLLEPALAKTLGIPLFQEQLMQMAIDVANFTASDADQLRQAMGSKRSQEKMENLRSRLFQGMEGNGIVGETAQAIWEKLAAFASFGFPESHSVSFAYLVYISSWLKYHYPAAFCAALLNAQPMGFYSPHSLVQDARRHGVTVITPDINRSGAKARLISGENSNGGQRAFGDPVPSNQNTQMIMGLEYVRFVGEDLALEIAQSQPYASVEDLRRRCNLSQNVLEALATAGALEGLVTTTNGRSGDPAASRRVALWEAGAMAQTSTDQLDGIVTGVHAPTLPGMSEQEMALADLWSTGIAVDGHPTRFVREHLDQLGVVSAEGLKTAPGPHVVVAGVVTHRQRPATAGGVTFVNLEDETGLINVVVYKGIWTRFGKVARSAPALLVRGRLERNEGVVNVIAESLELLPAQGALRSRDFR